MAFEISIGANVQGLKKSLAEGIKATKEFETAAVTSSSLAESAIASVGKGGATMARFSKDSNSAALALQNLGRVAQDAPFGFIGIQNNLNPLLESFQRLKSESGSTGGALKALAGSLMGAGGLGFAISAASALMLAWPKIMSLFSKSTKEAAEITESFTKIRQAGEANAQKEITTIDTLYRATQNQTLSLSERTKAVNILQDKYPSYLKNISDEDILAGRAADAYLKLKNAIVAKAIAQSKEDEISKKAIENDKLKFNNEVNQQAILRLEREKTRLSKGSTGGGSELATSEDVRILQINNEINESKEQQVKNGAKINRNNLTMSLLSKEIDNSIKQSGVDMLDLGKNTEKVNKVLGSTVGSNGKKSPISFPAYKEPEIDFKIQLPEFPELAKAVDLTQSDLQSIVGDSVPVKLNIELPPLQTELSKWQKSLADFDTSASNIIRGGITDSFAMLGDAIGSAFSGGGNIVEDLSAGLLSGLADVLQQLGKMAIATGVAMLAIKNAFKSPATAIAAGIGLIAVSKLARAGASGIASKVGGTGSSSGSVSSGASSNSVTSYAGGGGGAVMSGGTVVFEIAGTKLIGVLNNAGYSLSRTQNRGY